MRIPFFRKKDQKKVSFATTCWEGDWEKILLHSSYLQNQIDYHSHLFSQKILVINNVNDPKKVEKYANKLLEKKIITDLYFAEETKDEVLDFFELTRESFKKGADAHQYHNVTDDWIFYNALGVLTAIYFCKTDYFLYTTGDTFLREPISWIEKAIKKMESKSHIKVANLTWNEKFSEAKKESYKQDFDFFIAKQGFSDQMFLVKRADFQKPIYGEIREDASHFPRGDVFEKRVFSYMKNHQWKRITYKHGSYFHQ